MVEIPLAFKQFRIPVSSKLYIESYYDNLYSLISSYITYHPHEFPINLLENHIFTCIIFKNPLCTQNAIECLVKYVQLLKPSKEEEEKF